MMPAMLTPTRPPLITVLVMQEVRQADSEAPARGTRICGQLCQLQGSQKGMCHSYIPLPTPALSQGQGTSCSAACSAIRFAGFEHVASRLLLTRPHGDWGILRLVPLTRCHVIQLIKKLSATPTLAAQVDVYRSVTPVDSQAALQANKATFFFQLVSTLPGASAS